MGGVKMSGDFAKLQRLIRGMEKLAAGRFIAGATRALGEEALNQVQESFAAGRSPYGRKWKGPSSRPGGQPLRDTGRLMNSFSLRFSPTNFTLSSNVIYAAIHNYGGTIRPVRAKALFFRVGKGPQAPFVRTQEVSIPQRQFLPSSSQHLGRRWSRAFRDVLADQRRKALGR
jgi:phage gpG-like protein